MVARHGNLSRRRRHSGFVVQISRMAAGVRTANLCHRLVSRYVAVCDAAPALQHLSLSGDRHLGWRAAAESTHHLTALVLVNDSSDGCWYVAAAMAWVKTWCNKMSPQC
jgi:hypothetical protein